MTNRVILRAALYDTGSSDPTITPKHMAELDPSGALTDFKMVEYEQADGETIQLNATMLETKISAGDGSTVMDWEIVRVGIQKNDNDDSDDIECLSGCDFLNYCYTATNPGPPAQLRMARLVSHITKTLPSGQPR